LRYPWVVGRCFVNVHYQFYSPCTSSSWEAFLNERDQVSIDESWRIERSFRRKRCNNMESMRISWDGW
jgi:hypothetical protein